MIVEILSIGRELLDGRVIDTNSATIAHELRGLGLVPRFGQRVDDDLARIIMAFGVAASRSRIIIATGGLGPTSDDITAEAFARFLGEALVPNPDAMRQVEAYFQRLGRPLLEVQRKQAMLPPSCFVLENKRGSAPGFGLVKDGLSWFFMPGVPREAEAMLREQVIPRLPHAARIRSMEWATHFTTEGGLQQKLTPVEAKLPRGFEVAYCTRFPENHISLYAPIANGDASLAFESACEEIGELLGPSVFSTARDGARLAPIEEVIVERSKAKRFALATAESCTGGLVASRLTDVSGASETFWGSFVTYDYAAKHSELGVTDEILKSRGAVSPETARALAVAGLEEMERSIASGAHHAIHAPSALMCVSTTGIAGPTGGTPEKPVGLCFVALARKQPGAGEPVDVSIEEIRGVQGLTRAMYKQLFAQKALELVRQAVMR
jgi:nicotinamide-nucleotide amidase